MNLLAAWIVASAFSGGDGSSGEQAVVSSARDGVALVLRRVEEEEKENK